VKTCDSCGRRYDPVACRWRCPACGLKEDCCEGAPQ
jgi:transposase